MRHAQWFILFILSVFVTSVDYNEQAQKQCVQQAKQTMKIYIKSQRPPSLVLNIVILLLLLVSFIHANFVLSVTSTSYQVNDPANVTVNIRTSTTISTLDIMLSNVFIITTPRCLVNGVAATCNRIVPATGALLYVRYSYSFAASTNYTLFFNATNPSYSDSFSIQAYNGATSFVNSGSLTINPKTIVCSMTSSSSVVSMTSNATFLIGVSTLASGTLGKLSLSVNAQTIFPNVINSSPQCMVDSFGLSCSLGLVFGLQVLSISPADVGIRTNGTQLNLIVNSIRNAPYNSSFENITVSVKDSMDRDIQKCIVQQPPATILQQSSIFALQGWGSLVGQVSNVQFLLTAFFTPLSDLQILLVYPTQINITPRPPAVYTITSSEGQNYLKVTNVTVSSLILQFNATFENPSAVIPLSMQSYILYNDTLFREQKVLPAGSLTLVKQVVVTTVSLGNSKTLVSTSINITLTSPIQVSNGIIITATIQYGSFVCANLGLASSLGNITLLNCTALRLIVRTSNQINANSTVWVSSNYLTHTSTAPNTISIEITSIDNYAIMSGQASVSLNISEPLFTVTSSNSTYIAFSNYTVIQANVTQLGSSVIRAVVFVPPAYVKISDSTTVVTANPNASTVVSFSVDLAGNTVSAVIRGKIQVTLISIINPSHFLGARQWNITCKDNTNYPSSSSTAIHTPQYSPPRNTMTVSLTNTTIQQTTNITLTFQPLLQYSLASPPTLFITFSYSSINNVINSTCPSCTLLTSTKFSMTYYSVVMRPIIEIVNNKDPNNNNVTYFIAIGDFVYQTGFVVYQLDPMQFTFTSSFTGQYENLGQLEIHITSTISTPLSLNYTGTDSIFTANQQCQQCNSTYLFISGIVGFFQTQDVVIQGYSNGTLYARGVVRVKYTCSQISGCQLCQTVNSTLICNRCFNNLLSDYYLLYENICYSVCPVMTYENGAVCSDCQHLCYKCTATKCLECVTNYYIYSESCVLNCPPLYIKNATHCLPRPVICPSHCIDCPSDNVCNKCDANYYLLENLCYTSCPKNYLPNSDLATCQLFVPPQETNYFPFAFFIASIVSLVLLRIIRFFQKRSLVLGNFISLLAFFEIGAMVMLISYTFISISQEPKRWINNNKLLMQGLIFIIILTKVVLNIIFLIYFQRKIAHDDNFERWIQKSPYNYRLYIVLLVLSTIFSFQIMRIIYCRFLGLEIFFGRFNTALIFKPLNFFSLAYVVPGGGLIVMAVFDIIMQDGYRTSIFYSSIQVIMIESINFIACIVEACRNDKQYFDYQIYKVENLEEDTNSASKISIMEQEEVGGSVLQIPLKSGSKNVGPVGLDPDEVGNQTAGKIIRNKRWREKKPKPLVPEIGGDGKVDQPQQIIQIEDQIDDINQNLETNSDGLLKLSSMVDGTIFHDKRKQRSIFRKKILEDWEKLKDKLPKVGTHRSLRSSSRMFGSKSPNNKRSPIKLKKMASLQKIERIQIKTPIPSFKNKKQLKNHFYKIKKAGEADQEEKQSFELNISEKDINISESKTLEENNFQINENGYVNGLDVENTDMDRQDGEISQIQNNQNEESFERSLLELRKDIKANRYDFENETIQEDEQQKQDVSKNKDLTKNSADFTANKRKLKKRNVNKQTEAVYLQRLVSSSDNQRPKTLRRQKLQDF